LRLQHRSTAPRRQRRFNPLMGFLCIATRDSRRWLESSACFNPFVGFLCIATSLLMDRRESNCSFQSLRGFSLYFDTPTTTHLIQYILVSIPSRVFCALQLGYRFCLHYRIVCFQSLAGFSVHCNPTLSFFVDSTVYLSIPSRVFCALQQVVTSS
jgi:hypothetical protein